MRSTLWLNSWFVAALAALLLFSCLGSFPLTDRDEGEYATSASEMIRSGDYVVPTMNGRPYLEKPILFFWVLSGSFKILGENELSARMPSALTAFVLIISMFYLLDSSFCQGRLAQVSGLVLLSSPLFLLLARACLTDMLLTLFVWLSMILFFQFLEKGKPAGLWGLSWLFLSLGFLTKGPVAVAMCLPVYAFYSAFKRDFSWIRTGRLLAAAGIFMLVNLPWYLAMYERLGRSFIETFFITENLERFGRTLLGHGGGPFFYIAVLMVGLSPFSMFLPSIIKRDCLLLKKALGNSVLKGEDRLLLFCFLSTAWIFCLLTAAATKQINYILPLVPFLSISIGSMLLQGTGWSRPIQRGLLLVVCGLFLIVSALLFLELDFTWNHLIALVRFDSTGYAFPASPPRQLSLWGAGLCSATIFCAYMFMGKNFGITRRFFASIFFSSFVVLLFLPCLCRLLQCPAKHLSLDARNIVQRGGLGHTNARIVSFGLWKPSMIFYAGTPIKRIKTKHPERLEKALSDRAACLVFTRSRLKDRLEAVRGFLPIREEAGYLLGGNRRALLLLSGHSR